MVEDLGFKDAHRGNEQRHCERYNYENFQGTIFKHKEVMPFI